MKANGVFSIEILSYKLLNHGPTLEGKGSLAMSRKETLGKNSNIHISNEGDSF